VAAALPQPWDVVMGIDECTRETVAHMCRLCGVDPEPSGWTAPLATSGVAAIEPTPALVHGVEVASPAWACILRKAGVFGGAGKARPGGLLTRAVAEAAGAVKGPLPSYDEQGNLL
jgi:hypothetical protein